MAARYYVLVSQALLDTDTPWHEAGLELIEQRGFTEPGMRWCLFADENAPEELNGRKVELTIERGVRNEGDPDVGARIIRRRVIG